jgi:hypothetical protein
MKQWSKALLLLALISTPSWGQSADFNSDGTVNFADFFLFVDAFSQPVDDTNRPFDLNGDGSIGFPDFFVFVDSFGKVIEPTFDGLAVARTDNPLAPRHPQARSQFPSYIFSFTRLSAIIFGER